MEGSVFMFQPNLIEKIEHRITVIISRILRKNRNRKLNNKDFTIISNNCWGVFAMSTMDLVN